MFFSSTILSSAGPTLKTFSAVMPVFWDGSIVAFVHAASHWPDVGGPVPGSFNAEARSTYAEGLLIPPIHLVRAGVWDQEVEALILRNVRVQRVIEGDLRGLVEACRMGRSELLRLLHRYGSGTIIAAQGGLLDLTEHMLRAEFAGLPDGTYSWTDYIDRDPCGEATVPLPVAIDLTIRGDRATYDLSRSAPEAEGTRQLPAQLDGGGVHRHDSSHLSRHTLKRRLHARGRYRRPERGHVVSAGYPAPVSGSRLQCRRKDRLVHSRVLHANHADTGDGLPIESNEHDYQRLRRSSRAPR